MVLGLSIVIRSPGNENLNMKKKKHAIPIPISIFTALCDFLKTYILGLGFLAIFLDTLLNIFIPQNYPGQRA